jgi:hypothetical protein
MLRKLNFSCMRDLEAIITTMKTIVNCTEVQYIDCIHAESHLDDELSGSQGLPMQDACTTSLPVLIRSAWMTASMMITQADADCISSGSGGGVLTGGKNFSMTTPG